MADNMVEVYMGMLISKDMWDALMVKFNVSNVGNDLYIMEKFYDYKMVDD
jgi:hypothetical protein